MVPLNISGYCKAPYIDFDRLVSKLLKILRMVYSASPCDIGNTEFEPLNDFYFQLKLSKGLLAGWTNTQTLVSVHTIALVLTHIIHCHVEYYRFSKQSAPILLAPSLSFSPLLETVKVKISASLNGDP